MKGALCAFKITLSTKKAKKLYALCVRRHLQRGDCVQGRADAARCLHHVIGILQAQPISGGQPKKARQAQICAGTCVVW